MHGSRQKAPNLDRRRGKDPLRRIVSLIILNLLLLMAVPTTQVGKGDMTIDSGPYALEMHFTELPYRWWDSPWWHDGWTCRQILSFDAAAFTEDLASFPVMVALDSTRINYSATQNAGQDIRFIDADGHTELDYEIETWNESGTSVIWVKVPGILAGTTKDHIWMYYGNSTVSDAQNRSSVWIADFQMVQHLGAGTRSVGTFNDELDSTSNGNSIEAVMEQAGMNVDAFIAGGVDLDGMDDYLESAGNEMDASGRAGTVELWAKTDNSSLTASVFDTKENGDRGIWTEGGQFHAGIADTLTGSRQTQGGVVDGNWHYLAFSWDIDDGGLDLFVDGVLVNGSHGSSWSSFSRMSPTRYGHDEAASTGFPARASFDGMMDEIRVSSAVRSSEWNMAQYKSMSDSLITYGGSEPEFKYRRRLTVTAGTEDIPRGFPSSVVFDHAALVSQGESREDGDDIRVAYWDGSAWIELDRILDPESSWNVTDSRMWFGIARPIAAHSVDDNYCLYYGNSTATNPPMNARPSAVLKSVQIGDFTSAVNGVTTVNIAPVNTSKTFLMMNSRHDSNRPVGSEIMGTIMNGTTLEFTHSTDEPSPSPISVQWYVVEFESGVKVQRGNVTQTATTINVALSPIGSIGQAFVLLSKSPASTDVSWSSDDPIVGEITTTANLQLRADGAHAGHVISWQVVEFLYPQDIKVQTGSIATMRMNTLSVNATLSTPVDMDRTFILANFRIETDGPDVGSRMLEARLVDSRAIKIDRDLAGSPDNITEILWQAVELRQGGYVLAGNVTFATGIFQKSIPLAVSMDVNRSVAFASVQTPGGQNMGRSPLSVDDVIGVGSATFSLTPSELRIERNNASADANFAWFVVDFAGGVPACSLGVREQPSAIRIVASVHHTRPDGTDPQPITTSAITGIDAHKMNPLTVDLGVGAQVSFSDSNPRLLRLSISVEGLDGGGRLGLAYASIARPSALRIPTIPASTFYLHENLIPLAVPTGRLMDTLQGASASSLTFDSVGQEDYWYASMWSPPAISLLTPTMNEHITGTYGVTYSAGPSVVNVSFEYFDGTAWRFIGYDSDMDGSFPWSTCMAGDGVVVLRGVGLDPLNTRVESSVSGIEIDCTPPRIRITQPGNYSEIQGDVPISYSVDSDAVLVEIRYDDGALHTIATESPPDGSAVWNVSGLILSGACLRAIAWDEVGLSSDDEVVGLSTPVIQPPVNKPPTISGVPDLIVHFDYSYNLDLIPYIRDEDNSTDDLRLLTSDRSHVWTSPVNHLGLVMNYPQSMLGMTVGLTIWVTDGIGTGYDVINVTIHTDYPPEKLRPLPDVSFDEDQTLLNAFSVNLDYYFLDVDGDNLYYTSGNVSVMVRINPNKTVDLWAAPDWFGFEIITMRATDPTGALVEDVVLVQVNPVNDAPIIDPIPDLHVWAEESYTEDLARFISDIDNASSELRLTISGRYCTVDGFNVTLNYPGGFDEDYVTLTVSDGIDSTTRIIRIVISSRGSIWPFILAAIVVVVLSLVVLFVILRRKSKVLGCYLVKDDGTLVNELKVAKTDVPYSVLKEDIERRGLSETDEFNHGKDVVTILHGKKLHLVVLSSSQIPTAKAARLGGILADVDEAFLRGGEGEARLRHDLALARFEMELARLTGTPHVG